MMPAVNMMRRLNRQFNNMKKFGLKTILASSCLLTLASPFVFAQNSVAPNEDITSSNFSLVVCDGPNVPSGNPQVPTYDAQGNSSGTRAYVVCDFAAAMKEVQHLINIMIIVGVVAAVAGFCYAGFLLIAHGSNPSSRTEASSVFKKVFIGFILMLTAWFIVYQLLSWLQCGANQTTCQSVGTALLKNSQ